MIKTVKLINTLNRTFNRVRPNATINVEEKDVDAYLSNGFERMDRKILDAKAETKKELKAKKDAETKKAKEDAEAKAQADAQAKLDEEHAKANPKLSQDDEKDWKTASDGEENGAEDDAVDLDGDDTKVDEKDAEWNQTKDAEDQTKLEDANDGDALIKELDKVPAPKKTTK